MTDREATADADGDSLPDSPDLEVILDTWSYDADAVGYVDLSRRTIAGVLEPLYMSFSTPRALEAGGLSSTWNRE